MNASGILKKLSWALAASSVFAAGSALAQQASINLDGSSINYCNAVHNTWKISKVVGLEGGTTTTHDLTVNRPTASVVWNIQAVKNPATSSSTTDGPTPSPVFCVEGTIKITNTGVGAASVGNIVVNLQRMIPVNGKKRWVSVAADISTKTNNVNATSANVVAAASAENADWNNTAKNDGNILTHNYTVGGPGSQIGTFTRGPASGDVTLSGSDWEDTFSTGYMVPGTAGPGSNSVTLTYVALFDGGALNIARFGRSPPHRDPRDVRQRGRSRRQWREHRHEHHDSQGRCRHRHERIG
jgi:hypothetical protein